MPRSNITSKTQDLLTDDGSILTSIVHGEQIRLNFTLSWATNLTGYTILAKAVEGDNIQGSGEIPISAKDTPVVYDLTVVDSDTSDNVFQVVIPEDLINSWDTFPEPDKPVYAFFDVEIQDTGVGNLKQIWKPVRGLIEVRYSPTEAS